MMRARQYITIFLWLAIALRASATIQNQGWWKNSVFYQIYPRSFMDIDKNDGIGDLKGITSKLEHFREIGVKGIWLSPINKSPMKDFGYDISDFRDIQGEYGTLNDFQTLIDNAKKLGLKVILDLVPNHTSDQHAWFQASIENKDDYKDYYIWVDPVKADDTTTPPNNWLSVFGGSAWTYNEKRKQWYFHQFLKEQPDLNYRNTKVRLEMQQIITYWLEKGIDGFRIDAVPHLFETTNIELDEPKSKESGAAEKDYAYLEHIYTKDQPETYKLVNEWRKLVDFYADVFDEDEKVIMTEAYTTLPNTLQFYESGSHIPFNFKFIIDLNKSSKPADFKKIIDSWIEGMPEGSVANWVMGNHDRKRIGTRYPNRADQMTMLAMILPGVAVTYYGEEIGMLDNDEITWEETKDQQACNAGKNNFQKVSRDPCRTPFQWNADPNAGFTKGDKTWLPVHKNHATLNLEAQKKNADSHYKVYTKLTSLRKTSVALQNGSYLSYVENDLLVVTRKVDGELVTLIINFSDEKEAVANISNYLTGTLLSTKAVVASVGSGITVDKEYQNYIITVPAKASVVLQSTFDATNGISKTTSDSFATIILMLITMMALRS